MRDVKEILDALAFIRVHLAPEGERGVFPLTGDWVNTPYHVQKCNDGDCPIWRHLYFEEGDANRDDGKGYYSVLARDLREELK